MTIQDCKSIKSGPGCGKESATLTDSGSSTSVDSSSTSSDSAAIDSSVDSSSGECPE